MPGRPRLPRNAACTRSIPWVNSSSDSLPSLSLSSRAKKRAGSGLCCESRLGPLCGGLCGGAARRESVRDAVVLEPWPARGAGGCGRRAAGGRDDRAVERDGPRETRAPVDGDASLFSRVPPVPLAPSAGGPEPRGPAPGRPRRDRLTTRIISWGETFSSPFLSARLSIAFRRSGAPSGTSSIDTWPS